MTVSTLDSLDFAIRAIQSIAFSLHSVLGITEPCTGCLRGAFRDPDGAIPVWFWPLAGILLAVVAWANIHFSQNDTIVLVAQAYIATFHSGGVYYHWKLGHHPAAGCAPGFFVVLAVLVTTIRANFLVAIVGAFLCVGLAIILGRFLVKVPPRSGSSSSSGQSEELLSQH
mmetsp:Transcript_18946/g.28064  ORF Transcript_18946/g.28064 Transcript_18946/m.28064 type:complete len:170 (+) Transcript_18946:142-651(+)